MPEKRLEGVIAHVVSIRDVLAGSLHHSRCGASVMLGVLLTATALIFGESIGLLLRVFPQSVLGIILFLAGAELAMSSREPGPDKVDRFLILTTAALAVWNVGFAVVFGILGYHASKRGWLNI